MDALLTPAEGLALLAAYGAVMFLVTAFFARDSMRDREGFLVAHRRVGGWASAFSIAATWIWAPSLFVAAQKAYTQGLAGVFWFTVPNVLCLVLFAFFAERLRARLPDGFTFAGYIQERFSDRTHSAYLFQLIGLSVCSFAVQLLAGGAVISALTGMPFALVTIVMALIALTYSLASGLKASVVTDYLQMLVILGVISVLVPWVVASAGGVNVVLDGLGGVSGAHGSIFDWEVFVTFGIPVTIGLLAGPFGDQSFWQRAFATRREDVRRAFIRGACIFAVVPVLMSMLGFVAAGAGLTVADTQLVNLETVLAYLPSWVVVPFVLMLLSGLVSTLDSSLAAVASLGGFDVLNRRVGRENATDAAVVRAARWSMLAMTAAALAMANLPGMKILYLFLFYGTLRAATLLPTVLSLLTDRLHEAGVFWGIVVAIVIGLPVFALGNFGNMPQVAVAGSIFTVLASGAIAVLVSAAKATSAGPARGARNMDRAAGL